MLVAVCLALPTERLVTGRPSHRRFRLPVRAVPGQGSALPACSSQETGQYGRLLKIHPITSPGLVPALVSAPEPDWETGRKPDYRRQVLLWEARFPPWKLGWYLALPVMESGLVCGFLHWL